MNNFKLRYPIFLCGMMGSGKSTIGKSLARRLDVPFSDLDAIITEQEGRSIPEIFSSDGEETFRKIEQQLLIKTVQSVEGVLALGGGSLQNQQITDHVKLHGWLIFINPPLSVLLSRLRRSKNRPMLNTGGIDSHRNTIERLMDERLPFYSQAHITINTDGLTKKDIVDTIVAKLKFYEQ
jgi:shikimate kinase